MTELTIETHRRNEIIDITEMIGQALPENIPEGLCCVYCPHTTAAITVNENYDPDVKHDLLEKLERMAPLQENFYQHEEGNSAAHLKASMFGFSQMIPFCAGHLALGTWQGIYFCEFDGPRTRKVRLFFMRTEG